MQQLLSPLLRVALIRRIAYTVYFLGITDWRKIAAYAAKVGALGYPGTLMDALRCAMRYGTAPRDYYELGYYSMPKSERGKWAGTATAYEFQRIMNAAGSRNIFKDKHAFAQRFARFFGREFMLLTRNSIPDALVDWVSARAEVIAKPRHGTTGSGVQKLEIPKERERTRQVLRTLTIRGDYVLEDVIKQHAHLASLNPTSVNTVRIVTILDDASDVQIIAAILRIGKGGVIDNYSAGGMAAPVDLGSGRVIGGANVLEPGAPLQLYHPITNARLVGFELPYWGEILDLVRQAAWVIPEVRTVGWDVAITENGPILVEGNDNWDKTIVQRTLAASLLPVFSTYIDITATYPRLHT